MKMILAIMPTNISDGISQKLIDSGYRVTKFASTAGWFSGGSTTLMLAADVNQIDRALELIRGQVSPEEPEQEAPPRITIYVLPVKNFEKV